MKNIKLLAIVLAFSAIVGFNACEKYERGGTAVESMCGEWVAYVVDFDMDFTLKTSNVANNEPNKIIVTDRNVAGTGTTFWGFAVKANCDVSSKTFSCTNVTNDFWTEKTVAGVTGVYTPYDIKISIRNGKITEKAVELPSGVKADKIELEIWFEDIGEEGFPADHFCKIVGYRYSGFSEDDDFVYTGE